jgi:hypothetical protein
MAVTSATSNSLSAAQLGMQQLRVQQAKQNAERAEAAAQSLRAQADAAQREAGQAQENARSLYVRSDQAQNIAGQARQGLVAVRSQGEMQVRLSNTVDQVVERANLPAVDATPVSVSPAVSTSSATEQRASPQPVVNTSGQVTGRVVNTTA